MDSLGWFDQQQKVSKNAARKGQAFSSAFKVAKLDIATEIEKIDDIEKGKYVFSDGCGEISYKLAQEIAKMHYKVWFCYAFQIRLGGYKGVLVCSDNFKDDYKVRVRPSMEKFEMPSDQNLIDLEVIRMATYSPGYLNKQIIGILWSNGVNPDIFLRMQRAYAKNIWENYDLSTLNTNSRCLNALTSSVKLIGAKIFQTATKMHDLMNDPFILPLVKLVNYNKFSDIRKRFRIYDPNCWVLIGVIDPHNCLEEGEVFVQCCKNVPLCNSKGFNKKLELLQGKLIVSRNPWVHPGDVRVLNAVDKLQLKSYWNVIVFSGKGDRPEQDKMASGDLDGDIYWINWRKEFIDGFVQQSACEKKEDQLKIENSSRISKLIDFGDETSSDEDLYEDYETEVEPVGEPISKISVYSRKDYIKNFITYIQNDYLGEVANLHSKIADSSRRAIKSKDWLSLAEMHCKAVDFQKHGELLDVDSYQNIKSRNSGYVDFMSYNKKNIRKDKIRESEGILGQMFRDLQSELNHEELLRQEYEFKILRKYPLPEHLFEDADFCQHLPFLHSEVIIPYNKVIKKLMVEKNLMTESDIFNANCAFTNIVSARDEVYTHQDEIEIILSIAEERFKTEVLKLYKKQFKSGKKLTTAINKAMIFASYFDLVHLSDPKLKMFECEAGYQEFITILQTEQKLKKFTPMSFEQYQSTVTSNYLEDTEVNEVVEQLKILSAWWVLTR